MCELEEKKFKIIRLFRPTIKTSMLDTVLLWMNLGECVCVGDGEAIGEGGVKEKVKLGLKKTTPHRQCQASK